jgi:putative flippase GtrA
MVDLPDDPRATARRLACPRLGQFLSVGAAGALVDNAVLVGLVELAALSPELAAVGAKEASILFMFVLNEHWTFAEHSAGTWRRRLVSSHGVRVVGAAVGIGTLAALTAVGVHYLLANVVGIGVGFAFNYALESLVTWQVASAGAGSGTNSD